MPTSRQIQALQTKQKIQQVAENLFLENGVESVTIRDIATESGVALGTLYHYFESKEALIRFINQKRYELMYQEITSAADLPPLTALDKFLASWFEFLLNDNINWSKHWFIMAFEQRIQENDHGENRIEEDIRFVFDILNNAVASGELSFEAPIREIARDMVFTMYGAVNQYCFSQGAFDMRDWGDKFMRITVPMILSPYKSTHSG